MTSSFEDFLGDEAFLKQVADFARQGWDQYGPGSVILNQSDLIKESDNRTHVGISYLPRSDESPLWEHEAADLLEDLNPETEFLLTSVQADGQALSLVLSQ